MDKKFCDICKKEVKEYVFLSSGLVPSGTERVIWNDFCYPCFDRMKAYLTEQENK